MYILFLFSGIATKTVKFCKTISKKIVKLTKPKAIPMPTEFKIDHPFLIIIQATLKKGSVILFMGRILEPVCE